MQPGDVVRYPDLAESLALIAKEGPDAFYRGAIAQAIVDEMARGGGLITREDLAAYEARVAPPLRGRYRDLELAFSPGATGGVTALEMLNILAEFPPAKAGWNTVDGLHARAMASKRAFLDRFEHLGDAAVVKAPWERLVSKEYAREVAADIRRRRAAPARRGPGAGQALDCTTHVGAVDRDRNMVSLTHTAVSIWGARVVVEGTGILLNNGMIWFDPEPGRANSVAPGKRVLVNMVPVLGFRRGRPYLTAGAPGGRAIVSAIPQVIANLVDGRGTLRAAVEAPRLHTEGGDVLVSTRVGEEALAGLARRGHAVVPKEESYSTLNFARPVAIRVTPKGLEAGLEQYGMAWAAGH
jgi:gamma-glutamyltranspeptidase/glutathione hydrolase